MRQEQDGETGLMWVGDGSCEINQIITNNLRLFTTSGALPHQLYKLSPSSAILILINPKMSDPST